MESLEILERKIREYIEKSAGNAKNVQSLREEIGTSREKAAALEAKVAELERTVVKLEEERGHLKSRVDGMIKVIEEHLGEGTP